MKPEESEAASVVAAQIGATDIYERDIRGAPPATHDFDLDASGRLVALEVTSLTDEMTRRFWDAVGDRQWKEPTLARSWGLVLAPGSNVKRLRSYVADLLRTLEHDGVERFDASRVPATWPVTAHQALRGLQRLGVHQGSSVDGIERRIVVCVVDPAGWSGGDSLADALSPAIDANIDKLRSTEADERHLFVWLDWSSQVGQASIHQLLTVGRLPVVRLDLPDGLDVVWVMPKAMEGQRGRPLHRATRAGWQLVEDHC